MTISEILSSKQIQNPVLSKITNNQIDGSVKQKDVGNDITIPAINISKKSDEIKKETEEKIQHISELMNDYVNSLQKDINIRLDYETGDVIVKVISEQDGKVIRQIPSEEMLALAAKMEEISGVFFDKTV